VGRESGCGTTARAVAPQDRENLSLPRRYTGNRHHDFPFFFPQQRSLQWDRPQVRVQALLSPPRAAAASAAEAALLRLFQRCAGRKKGKKSKLHFLEINLPNCLHFTTHSGRGGEKKSKTQGRRNSSVEAISGWEWERVGALMSSLAA